MSESAGPASPRDVAGRAESAREHPVRQVMQSSNTVVLGRTLRDNTGISRGGNLSARSTIQTDVSSTRDYS